MFSSALNIHQSIKKAISDKKCVDSYAKSSAICARLCACMEVLMMIHRHNAYYQTGGNGNHYHTVEDEVVEVLMEEQYKSRLSSYIDNFVGGQKEY